MIKASCVVNYPRTFLSKGIPIKLTKPLVILLEKPFAAIFLDRIGPVSVKFCVLNGKLNFLLLWTVMLQSNQYVSGQAKKVPWIISDLRKGMRDRYIAKRKPVKSLLSLTILKTGICTKGYVIRLMEMLNLVLKYPITVPMRFFSLMATPVKPGKWLTNSRPVRLNENSVTSSHEFSNAFRACFHGGTGP